MEEKRVNEGEGGSVVEGSVSKEGVSIKDRIRHIGMIIVCYKWWV